MSEEQDVWLAIITTPIGNLEDMTFRAVRLLKEADVVAAEDTRKARILFSKFEIPSKKVISHHVQNEHRTKSHIVSEVLAGKKVAVISEAGAPCISDPGFLVIREALANGIEPIFVPGVSALTFTAMASGLPSEAFTFYGFLPVKKGARSRVLEEIKESEKTAIIFESPMRVKRLVAEIVEFIGEDAGVSLVREATKLHEEITRDKAINILNSFTEAKLKGEFVVAISSRYNFEQGE